MGQAEGTDVLKTMMEMDLQRFEMGMYFEGVDVNSY